MSRRLHLVLSVFRSAFGNPTLRLVGTAYALFATAEFGIWLVLLVFAYQRGGATAGMTMALVQLVPCIVLAPFIGSLADRRRPSRVLRVGYALQTVSLAALAAGIGAGAPTIVIYLLAPLTALSLTVTRPAQAALLPAIVRTPDELTAANVMTGWTEGGASLAGPAIAGVALAVSSQIVVSLTASVAALALIAVIPEATAAFLLIAVVGLAGTVFDITGRTLLQRAAPPDAIAGAFSILEATTDFGLAAGAILVRIGIAVGGVRAALVAPAVLAVLLVAVLWRQLLRIDAGATVPHVEIQLLRTLPIFAALSPPSLEGVAKELEPERVPAGKVVITEGERGERYYAVADGRLVVTRAGNQVGTVGRGDGFGEIALVRDVPRQATVTAVTDCLLFSLDKAHFVTTLSGHASAASAVSAVVDRHLSDDGRPAPTDHAPDIDTG